jgi:DNA-binding Lrp family transcriptional regulator
MEEQEMRKEILDAISKNSRISVGDLAAMLGCEQELVEKEIKEMEDSKVICGYPTLINWDKTDCEKVTALIEVKVTPQRDMGFNKVAERIYKFEEVESVYLMSGGFDLTVIIQGKSMKEVARFVSEKLSTLEYVTSTATYFVLKKYKEHGLEMTGEKQKTERMLITP